MADDDSKKPEKGGRKILSPGTWYMLSFLIWSVILVPITMGAFFILRISVRIADLENQYSALFGLIFGLILSGIVGFFYAQRARKHAE